MVAAWDGRVVGVSTTQGKAAGGVGSSPSRTERGAAWVSSLVGSLSGGVSQNRACVILYVPEGVQMSILCVYILHVSPGQRKSCYRENIANYFLLQFPPACQSSSREQKETGL
jgi:hypothetical protein